MGDPLSLFRVMVLTSGVWRALVPVGFEARETLPVFSLLCSMVGSCLGGLCWLLHSAIGGIFAG